MKIFYHGQRIKVIEPGHPLIGKTGIVVRLRMNDDGAWVTMNEELPKSLESFPEGDQRHRNIILYPEQCEKEAV